MTRLSKQNCPMPALATTARHNLPSTGTEQNTGVQDHGTLRCKLLKEPRLQSAAWQGQRLLPANDEPL